MNVDSRGGSHHMRIGITLLVTILVLLRLYITIGYRNIALLTFQLLVVILVLPRLYVTDWLHHWLYITIDYITGIG